MLNHNKHTSPLAGTAITQSSRLLTFVDILVLHLKRFTFEKCPTHDGRLLRRKIEDRIDFPIDKLDLSSYILGPKHADAPPIYKVSF